MDERTRVLVVDDEPEICELLKDVLSGDGYAVETSTDARFALRRIEAEDFDAVITDLRMPDVDGLSVARAAKGRSSEMATIVVTAYASLQTAVGALRAGVDDYITKPFDVDQILEVVRKAVSVRMASRRNHTLLDQLKASNSRLQQHEKKLADRIIKTSQSLISSNARLSRHVGELSMLNDISQTLSNEMNLDALLNLSLKIVKEKMSVRGALVLLSEPPTDVLTVKACIGPCSAALGRCLHAGTGIAGAVAAERAPMLVENLERLERVKPTNFEMEGFRSCLAVPLMVKDNLVGVLLVHDKLAGEKFITDDIHLLMTIGAQMAVAVENVRLYCVLQDSTLRTVQALATSLEAKDNYTSGHSARVTHYAVLLAQRLALSAKVTQDLRYASQLHDIGKIGVTERILNKPERLNEWEQAAIKDHPVIGEKIIQSLDFLADVRKVVRHHHERWDGSGYPDGLKGEDIPLLARIMSIADSYDAMTTARPYRAALHRDEAIAQLRAGAGSQFDTNLVEQFLAVLKEEDPLSYDLEALTQLL